MQNLSGSLGTDIDIEYLRVHMVGFRMDNVRAVAKTDAYDKITSLSVSASFMTEPESDRRGIPF